MQTAKPAAAAAAGPGTSERVTRERERKTGSRGRLRRLFGAWQRLARRADDRDRGVLLRAQPRWFRVAALVLLGLGLLHIFVQLWFAHGGHVWGDSYTYVTFARKLAAGQFEYLDGPLAEMLAERRREVDRPGVWQPIWNHAVLPDGRTVCCMAIGYPLLLAGALRIGGEWLFFHVNFFLMALFLLLFVMTIWEGLGRTPIAFLTAAVAVLILPRLRPAVFNQFTYLWREPLFYGCLLGACWLYLRFLRQGGLAALGGMAFLLGYACAIKEANAVYAVWFGVMLLAEPRFRRHPRRLGAVALGLALFVLGLAPLLYQNLRSLGNPLLSLQLVRETSNYSITKVGEGLSAGNTVTTVQGYLRMYARCPWFAWPAVALAAAGALLLIRRPVGRLLAGLALVHLLVYLQWGNPDGRHIYWFHLPYVCFLAYALVRLGALILFSCIFL